MLTVSRLTEHARCARSQEASSRVCGEIFFAAGLLRTTNTNLRILCFLERNFVRPPGSARFQRAHGFAINRARKMQDACAPRKHPHASAVRFFWLRLSCSVFICGFVIGWGWACTVFSVVNLSAKICACADDVLINDMAPPRAQAGRWRLVQFWKRRAAPAARWCQKRMIASCHYA